MLGKGNVDTAWGSDLKRLNIRQNVKNQVVKIEGINYNFDIFRGFSTGRSGLVLNEPFKIIRRKNGYIAMERANSEEFPFKVLCTLFFRNILRRLTKFISRK